MEEIDIWRAAKIMVDRHQKDAPVQAAMMADRMIERGDDAGKEVWIRVMKVAEELLRERPRPDEARH